MCLKEDFSLKREIEKLARHYDDKRFEDGFASLCKMHLPTESLSGKRVLDVCCRRGKGVYKLSALVGERGRVIGVDWNEEFLEEARRGRAHAVRKSGLSHDNMEFVCAYPEDLLAAGIGSATMDAVYVNSVITLFKDQARALAEFARVLRPHGLLILETIAASAPRDEAVVAAARELGNSVQAARTEAETRAWLSAAGFEHIEVQDSFAIDPARGSNSAKKVAVAPSDEDVSFATLVIYARKRG